MKGPSFICQLVPVTLISSLSLSLFCPSIRHFFSLFTLYFFPDIQKRRQLKQRKSIRRGIQIQRLREEWMALKRAGEWYTALQVSSVNPCSREGKREIEKRSMNVCARRSFWFCICTTRKLACVTTREVEDKCREEKVLLKDVFLSHKDALVRVKKGPRILSFLTSFHSYFFALVNFPFSHPASFSLQENSDSSLLTFPFCTTLLTPISVHTPLRNFLPFASYHCKTEENVQPFNYALQVPNHSSP